MENKFWSWFFRIMAPLIFVMIPIQVITNSLYGTKVDSELISNNFPQYYAILFSESDYIENQMSNKTRAYIMIPKKIKMPNMLIIDQSESGRVDMNLTTVDFLLFLLFWLAWGVFAYAIWQPRPKPLNKSLNKDATNVAPIS